MHHRVHAIKGFLRHFFRYLLFVREIIVGQLLLLVIGGFAISVFESLPLEQSLYFTFITGLSIGYGDIAPQTGMGRLISICIGIIGMIITGITVAVATRALGDAIKEQFEHKP